MATRHMNGENDPMIGQTFAGRYEIRSLLGSGGMAVVYGGFDKMLRRDVAVKILRPEASGDPTSAERLQREAKAAGQMHHPHVITFHDVGMMGDQLFIVMELLRGRTLTDEREASGGQIGVLRTAMIGSQVAGALCCVHAANIVHRDLKPENIFVSQRNGSDYCKLLDFSIAKLPEEMVDGRLTQTGTVFGTPYYMAPEQAMGDPVSFQTDVYSLGAVLFELVAGRPPFEADNPIKLLTKQSMENPPKLSSLGVVVPVAFEELIEAMLEKVAWHRPATALDVQKALERVIDVGDDGSSRLSGKEKAKAKRKLAGKADVTMQGHYGAQSVGGLVSSPSAVYRRTAEREENATQPAVKRQRRSTQPRGVSENNKAIDPDVAKAAKPPQAPPTPKTPKPTNRRADTQPPPLKAATQKARPKPPASGRLTQPRPGTSTGRRRRPTMPSWASGNHAAINEDDTLDGDDQQ